MGVPAQNFQKSIFKIWQSIYLKSSYWISLYGCGLGAGESGSEVIASTAKL